MFDFDMLGLSPQLFETLDAAGFKQPTPIQGQAIPLALEGHDIMGLAQTGTGKTLAFGIPLLEHLIALTGKPDPKTAKALILAPTRELVNQIADSLKPLIKGTKVRIVTVVGGASLKKQMDILQRGTDLLVATPGRLIDLMDRKAVYLDQVQHLVLDEADQMLDMGFIHALRRIAPELGTPRQTMLFSATMPKQMEELAGAFLTNPRRVQVSPPGKAADKIDQSVHFLPKADKPYKLREILNADPKAQTLIFTRTKHGAERLMKGLRADGYNADSIHGNKSQGQRERALRGFRDGTTDIIVATDVAARGIDIPGVAYVINFDLPEVPDNYVHRIGRTARAGRDGTAIMLCSDEEALLLKQIQKVMKFEIPVASGTSPLDGMIDDAPKGNFRRGRGRKPSGPRGSREYSNSNGAAPRRANSDRTRDERSSAEHPKSDRAKAGGAQESQGPKAGKPDRHPQRRKRPDGAKFSKSNRGDKRSAQNRA